jgi:hypothetical protein
MTPSMSKSRYLRGLTHGEIALFGHGEENNRARSVAPVTKPAPAKIAWSSLEKRLGPVLKPEPPNGPY